MPSKDRSPLGVWVDALVGIATFSVTGGAVGFVLAGSYLAARGEDTGAALGAMFIGAPLGGVIGMVLGAVSHFIKRAKRLPS